MRHRKMTKGIQWLLGFCLVLGLLSACVKTPSVDPGPQTTGVAEAADDAADGADVENGAAQDGAGIENGVAQDGADVAYGEAQATADAGYSSDSVAAKAAAKQAVDDFRGTRDLFEQTDAYRVYEMSFVRDGLYIYGRLYLPKNEEAPYPLVVIGHGLESSYAACMTDAEYFANAGIAACIFDFCGGSSYSESDGSMQEMSVLTEEADMSAVLDELCGLGFFNENELFLMGESLGGLVAALLAAKRAEDIAGLALYYPAFSIPDMSRDVFGSMENIPEDTGMYLGSAFYRDTIEMDAFAEARKYQGDVLIVHGDQDQVVPLEYSERAVEEYENAQLIILPGAEHGFFDDYLSAACEDAVSFVQDHIGK